MSNVLLLTSSPRGEVSSSTQVATELAGKIAGAQIVKHDLWRDPLPHIAPENVHAAYTPADARTDAQNAALAKSDELVAELKAADIVIVAASMVNFAVPSTLKAWIDHIVRAGVTFSYGEAGPVGLVTGKKLVLVLSSGGVYSAGPMAPFDHMGPYLRSTLGFLGMTDVETVVMEGSAFGPEAAEKTLAEGRAKAAGLAAALAA